MFELFLILRIIKRDIVINLKNSVCKIPVILVVLWRNLNFIGGFSKKKSPVLIFIKMRLMWAEFLHVYIRTDITKLIVCFCNLWTRLKTRQETRRLQELADKHWKVVVLTIHWIIYIVKWSNVVSTFKTRDSAIMDISNSLRLI